MFFKKIAGPLLLKFRPTAPASTEFSGAGAAHILLVEMEFDGSGRSDCRADEL